MCLFCGFNFHVSAINHENCGNWIPQRFPTIYSFTVYIPYTVDREIFAVKIFSDSMASPKIKHAKIMRTINDSAVRGRLSENYLTRKFIVRNICNAKYSRITVYTSLVPRPFLGGGGGEKRAWYALSAHASIFP